MDKKIMPIDIGIFMKNPLNFTNFKINNILGIKI